MNEQEFHGQADGVGTKRGRHRGEPMSLAQELRAMWTTFTKSGLGAPAGPRMARRHP